MDTVYGEHETAQVAQSILAGSVPQEERATIIGLSGELGAGKTTLVKSIAALLGVKDTLVSPTFVIAKWYDTADARWKQLVHMDAYRIEQVAELDHVGWEAMIRDPHTLLVIEWPERITKRLPGHVTQFSLDHHGDMRRIHKLSNT